MSLQNWFGRQRAPVTLWLMGTLVVLSILAVSLPSTTQSSLFFDNRWYLHPWSLLTYSFVAPYGFGLISLVFFVYWGLFIGGMVEREMGSRRYLAFVGLAAVSSALVMWLGSLLFRAPLLVYGPFFVDAAVTVAWATRFSTMQIRICGIIPVQARVIGWLFVIGLYMIYAGDNPVMGLFALLPLALVWSFAENNLPISFGERQLERNKAAARGNVAYDDSYYDEVRRREQDRAERERLRKLFGE